MKKISIFVLVIVLCVCALAGCRRKNANETTAPTKQTHATTEATKGTTVPATTENHRETENHGAVGDIITEGSEIIDDILPDGTHSASEGGNENRARRSGMPRY